MPIHDALSSLGSAGLYIGNAGQIHPAVGAGRMQMSVSDADAAIRDVEALLGELRSLSAAYAGSL